MPNYPLCRQADILTTRSHPSGDGDEYFVTRQALIFYLKNRFTDVVARHQLTPTGPHYSAEDVERALEEEQ